MLSECMKIYKISFVFDFTEYDIVNAGLPIFNSKIPLEEMENPYIEVLLSLLDFSRNTDENQLISLRDVNSLTSSAMARMW